MKDLNILDNHAAIEILKRASDSLSALGVHCSLSPMSLPQGMSISLHVGATMQAAVAAEVASTHGGVAAHGSHTGDEFADQVAASITDAVIEREAYRIPTNQDAEDACAIGLGNPLQEFITWHRPSDPQKAADFDESLQDAMTFALRNHVDKSLVAKWLAFTSPQVHVAFLKEFKLDEK
jgi:hypothetical protein